MFIIFGFEQLIFNTPICGRFEPIPFCGDCSSEWLVFSAPRLARQTCCALQSFSRTWSCASTEGFFAANEGSVGLLPERNCQQLWSVHISTPLVFYCCAALIVATSAMPFDIRAIAVISHTHR